MKLACLQTATLGWYVCVAMETSSSWQQADYQLLSARGTYVRNMKSERVELTVHSKKETSGRVKMGQESTCTAVVYPPPPPPRKSRTNSEHSKEKQMAGSKWAKGQTGLRVKMGQGSRGAAVAYPQKESN